MEGASTTDSLRALAPKWSLAGDDQLLKLLQSTHQKILSICQEVNTKLEEMALSLEDTAINLQNVNNKFMALSNSQFIESRVYDDEAELLAEDHTAKEPQITSAIDEISIIKTSLSILDRSHESAEILDDSDSDSSDAEINVVLKLKDMYPDRPLPYIIGSQPWKNKWHAGLVVEDSDSDSSTSKREGDRDVEQYSDTESEDERPREVIEDHTISETSSSFTSEQQTETTPVKQSPADIAAELARRLAGPVKVIEREPEEYVPPPITKVYIPEKPATSTIFPDEPPPLDNYVQESSQSEDEDIFAEINKNKPYNQRNPIQTNLADDLFGFDKPASDQDIFSDFPPRDVNPTKPSKPKSTLFDDKHEPEPVPEPANKEIIQNYNNVEKQEETTKKPIGGISLFGSNKGTESIGAAILRRSRRKSSTSGDESGSDNLPNQIIEEKPKNMIQSSKHVDEVDKTLPKKEKDIFKDLFAKPQPEKKPQKTIKDVKVSEKKEDVKVSKKKKDVKDLFSDNIFDDIDDIFTSNVVIPKESKQKSIFDDDDELFSDIAEPKTIVNQTTATKNDRKNIFDSDDELFSDVKVNTSTKQESHRPNTSIFSDKVPITIDNKEIGTRNDIQNDVVEDSPKINRHMTENNREASKIDFVEPTETIKERNLFDDSPQSLPKPEKKHFKNISIFESDSEDDIFASVKMPVDNKPTKITDNIVNNRTETTDVLPPQNKPIILNVKPDLKTKVVQSPSLFDDDDDDELFASTYKPVKDVNKEEIKEDIFPIQVKNEFENDFIINSNNDSVGETIVQRSEGNVLPSSEEIRQIEQNETEPAITIDNDFIKEDSIDDHLIENVIITPKEQTIIQNITEVVEHKDIDAKTTLSSTQGPDCLETSEPNQVIEPKEKEALTTDVKIPLSIEHDIFDDILSEPPMFEKPAEPKKSKNINALFDDDSDDEALFFKKDDVVTDEKPEIFTSNANFDIFVDEPPAIDVDFTPKSSKTVHFENDEDISTPKSYIPETPEILETKAEDRTADETNNTSFDNQFSKDFHNLPPSVTTNIEDIPSDNSNKIKNDRAETTNKPVSIQKDLFADLDKDLFSTDVKASVQAEEKVSKVIENSGNDLFGSLIPKSSQNTEKITHVQRTQIKDKAEEYDDIFNKESPKKEELKKIGKLNTKNLNINVNALMPGASPTKVPKEQDKREEIEPKMVKLFSSDDTDVPKTDKKQEIDNKLEIESNIPKNFETKPESEVLDNNLSKQRARIQVKRRPSTRRARHEAARKSGIDFGEDTDNSSSLDEPVKVRQQNNSKRVIQDTTPTNESKEVLLEAPNDPLKPNENIVQSQPSEKERRPEIDNKKGSTTKIVYILNDEDIFNIKSDIDKKSEDIFGNKTENDSKINPIQTLSNTYKEQTSTTKDKQEKVEEVTKKEVTEGTKEVFKDQSRTKDLKSSKIQSLFDDSDEDLFKTDKKVTKKTNIFESDSEEELFTGKKKKEQWNEEQKNREVKQKVKESLFSDDDDNDDLFGVKIEKLADPKPPTILSTSKEAIVTKTAQPVFDDPLSMLEED